MKKIIQKILAGVLSLVLVFGTLAGAEVKAAEEEPAMILYVYARDTAGKAVDGLNLVLRNKNNDQITYELEATSSYGDSSGITEFDVGNEFDMEAGAYYLEIAGDSEYTCVNTVEVVIAEMTMGNYTSLYIDTVGGSKYSEADGFILEVKSATAEAEAALDTAIKEASEAKEADYTAESWKAYKAAVDAAKALIEKGGATEKEYQDAINAINDAKGKLVKAEAPKKPSATQNVKVTKLTLSGISKKIAAGKKVQLTVTVAPDNAANKAVTWTTSNKKYATVNANGKVTVKKAGAGKTVTITATATDGSGVKATYKIKIMKNAVKKISLKAKKTVKAGKKVAVKATVKTTGKKANKKLKWTSSNTKYATVTSKGKVTTKKAGKGKKVKITATATDGSNKKKTVTIKIK